MKPLRACALPALVLSGSRPTQHHTSAVHERRQPTENAEAVAPLSFDCAFLAPTPFLPTLPLPHDTNPVSVPIILQRASWCSQSLGPDPWAPPVPATLLARAYMVP